MTETTILLCLWIVGGENRSTLLVTLQLCKATVATVCCARTRLSSLFSPPSRLQLRIERTFAARVSRCFKRMLLQLVLHGSSAWKRVGTLVQVWTCMDIKGNGFHGHSWHNKGGRNYIIWWWGGHFSNTSRGAGTEFPPVTNSNTLIIFVLTVSHASFKLGYT